jgi:Uma2 family endonuclease
MTIVMSDRDHDLLDVVKSIHDGLELPDGFRAEIVGGQIAVAASPFGMHAFIVGEIRRAATHVLPPDEYLYENVTLEEPGGDRYIPDLALLPDALVRTRRQWIFPMGMCRLAVEVTSPEQEDRDYRKAMGYARAGTPVYLIVDQKRRRCIVHSEPEDTKYVRVAQVPFGQDVVLPFERTITIDTSRFSS